MLYSKSTGGFYLTEIHGANIPTDAVEISAEDHLTLMSGQSEGRVISSSEDGYPILTDAPPQPLFIPKSITRRQGRLALLATPKTVDGVVTNYLVLAEKAISEITDIEQRMAAQIEYEADTWERDNEFLQAMWMTLGGTEEELDELFILAYSK